MPAPPEQLQLISYADDTTLAASGPKIPPLCDKINGYLPSLLEFFENRQLMVSAEKSSVTLFTPHTGEAKIHPQIRVHGKVIPLAKQVKILGVIHDTMYTFTPHRKYATTRTRQRLNVLKAMTGSDWGQDKVTLIDTFRATARPVAEYAAPIWAPGLSDTGWSKLQTVQNEALRIATGCHRMTDVDHLHTETKVLPLREHATMLSQQYLISCHQQNHPCNDIVSAPAPPRHMKQSLVSAFGNKIKKYIPHRFLSPLEHKKAITELHTATVESTRANYRPNKVLGQQPPPIDISEERLSRGARTTLAQLRSGYCKLLNSYQSRISNAANICPDCGATPHDVSHIFDCAANPTRLTPLDLWTKPTEVARFLHLH
jgi:hypothetical protein